MSAIDDFITHARDNNLSDETIRQTLESQGWDKNTISLALVGLTAPKPEQGIALANPTLVHPVTSATPTIHPLFAALQHVLLWFFVISSSIAIAAVVASLFGETVGGSALAALIAVTAITFTPYAVLYIMYLRKVQKQPTLIPGKVWSIITICLNSLGALAAAITLVVSAILGGEASVQVGSALIFALTSIVLTVYIFAAFVPSTAKSRKPILLGYLPVLTLLLGTLFVMSVFRLGPTLADEHTRENLTMTVQNIAKEVKNTNKLPSESDATEFLEGSDITYKKLTTSTYQLCTQFTLDLPETKNSYSSSYDQGTVYSPISDSYVYESNFQRSSGNQCFVIKSSTLPVDKTEIDIYSPSGLFND